MIFGDERASRDAVTHPTCDHPATAIELLPAIGDVDAILGAIAEWLVGAIVD